MKVKVKINSIFIEMLYLLNQLPDQQSKNQLNNLDHKFKVKPQKHQNTAHSKIAELVISQLRPERDCRDCFV